MGCTSSKSSVKVADGPNEQAPTAAKTIVVSPARTVREAAPAPDEHLSRQQAGSAGSIALHHGSPSSADTGSASGRGAPADISKNPGPTTEQSEPAGRVRHGQSPQALRAPVADIPTPTSRTGGDDPTRVERAAASGSAEMERHDDTHSAAQVLPQVVSTPSASLGGERQAIAADATEGQDGSGSAGLTLAIDRGMVGMTPRDLTSATTPSKWALEGSSVGDSSARDRKLPSLALSDAAASSGRSHRRDQSAPVVPQTARDEAGAMQRKAEIPMLRAASATSLSLGRSMYDLYGGATGARTARGPGGMSSPTSFISREQLVMDALNSRRVAMDVAGSHVKAGTVRRVRRGSIKGDSAATQEAVSALELAIQTNAAANPTSTDWQGLTSSLPVVPKTETERLVLAEALGRNFLFSGMSMEERQVIVDAMQRVRFAPGDVVVEQGQAGERCFVIETGMLEVLVNDETAGELDVGEVFGELALLYGSPNAATIRAVFPASLWALDRPTFRSVVLAAAVKQYEDSKRFLRGVALLSKLSDSQVARLAEAAQRVHFVPDTRIVMQGEIGHVFYIVMKGAVRVLKKMGLASEDARRAPTRATAATSDDDGDGDGIGPLHSARDEVGRGFGSERAHAAGSPRGWAASRHEPRPQVPGAADDEPSPRGSRSPAVGPHPALAGGPSAVSLHVPRAGEHTSDAQSVGKRSSHGAPIPHDGQARVSMRAMVGGVVLPDAQVVDDASEDGRRSSIDTSAIGAASQDAGNQEIELMQLEVGSWFGEQALLNDAPRAASVVAVGDVTCLALHRDDFFTLLGPLEEILRAQHAERQEVEKTVRRLHSNASVMSAASGNDVMFQLSPHKSVDGPSGKPGFSGLPSSRTSAPRTTPMSGLPSANGIPRTFTFTERQMQIFPVAESAGSSRISPAIDAAVNAGNASDTVTSQPTIRTPSAHIVVEESGSRRPSHISRDAAATPPMPTPLAATGSTPGSGGRTLSGGGSGRGLTAASAAAGSVASPPMSATVAAASPSRNDRLLSPSGSGFGGSSGLLSPGSGRAVTPNGHRSSFGGRTSIPQLAPIRESPRDDSHFETEISPQKSSTRAPAASPSGAAANTAPQVASVSPAGASTPSMPPTTSAASTPTSASTATYGAGLPGSLASVYASNLQNSESKRIAAPRTLPPLSSSAPLTQTLPASPMQPLVSNENIVSASQHAQGGKSTSAATVPTITATQPTATLLAPASATHSPARPAEKQQLSHVAPAVGDAAAGSSARGAASTGAGAVPTATTLVAPGTTSARAEAASSAARGATVAVSAAAPAADASAAKRAGAAAASDASRAPRADVRLGDLEYLAVLGEGAFGLVRLVRHKLSGEVWALKQMQKAKIVAGNQMRNVVNEKKILSRLRHPFIIEFIRTFKDRDCLFLLSEYCPGGDLFGMLIRMGGVLSVSEATWYAAAVASVLEYLHSMDIVYRDLKPENLLLDAKGFLKVCDFGFAKIVTDRTYTLCGTPEYLAPELVQGRGHGKGVDWWALGVLVYEMLVGYSPFADHEANEQVTIYKNILRGNLRFPSALRDSNAKDLIKKLLTANPSQRLGCLRGGGADVRKHPFFARLDFDALLRRAISPPVPLDIKSATDTSCFDRIEADTRVTPYVDNGDPWDAEF